MQKSRQAIDDFLLIFNNAVIRIYRVVILHFVKLRMLSIIYLEYQTEPVRTRNISL